MLCLQSSFPESPSVVQPGVGVGKALRRQRQDRNQPLTGVPDAAGPGGAIRKLACRPPAPQCEAGMSHGFNGLTGEGSFSRQDSAGPGSSRLGGREGKVARRPLPEIKELWAHPGKIFSFRTQTGSALKALHLALEWRLRGDDSMAKEPKPVIC